MVVIKQFLTQDHGQDLVEYALLIAFVCMASAALFVVTGGSIDGIWTQTNQRLSAASVAAS